MSERRFSTLFATPAPIVSLDGSADERYAIVGRDDLSVTYHGQPGAPLPEDAVVIRSGETAWTWMALAAERPELVEALVPHEWMGERTVTPDFDIAPFTNEAARRALGREATE